MRRRKRKQIRWEVDEAKNKYLNSLVKLPQTLIATDLSSGERFIYWTLKHHLPIYVSYCDCFPSRERLAQITGYHPTTISKYVKGLQEKGWISIDKQFKKDSPWPHNIYIVYDKPLPVEERKTSPEWPERAVRPQHTDEDILDLILYEKPEPKKIKIN